METPRVVWLRRIRDPNSEKVMGVVEIESIELDRGEMHSGRAKN
jgi:hypothetical protein